MRAARASAYGAGGTDAAPGHRVETVDGLPYRDDERELLSAASFHGYQTAV
jgi:hypothetical protein